MLSLVLCTIITVGFVAPSVVFADEQSQTTEVSEVSSSTNTFEKIKSFVDSEISFDGSRYILNDPAEIESFLIQNECQVSSETNTEFSGAKYFEYILKNIEKMNAKLAEGNYHTTVDNGIEKNIPLTRQAKPEMPYRLTSHWWGLKFQSFGHNGTIDLKRLFSDSIGLQIAAAGVLACSPAAVFGIIPALGVGYDTLVLNAITALIEKEQDKKGIQVDTNNWVPHFSVYAN
ncbi:hypothetical protein RV12_GL000420 [Enterococcus quebecensis]|nr:hypothetical protein RV12_GL000420 [Enterococcus quebecensis]